MRNTYTVVQHDWGFEVRNIAIDEMMAEFRTGTKQTFSACRTLAQRYCDVMNGVQKKEAA